MSEAYEKLQNKIYKDMGDFGGWHGLKQYCVKWYSDDNEVMDLVNEIEEEQNESS